MSLKDDPARLLRGTYRLGIGIRVLFSDMDSFRVVNNGAIGRFFEEGRADVNVRVFGAESLTDPPGGQRLMFATIEIDYLAPARYPGDVEIATGIVRIGSSSLVYAQAGFQGGACFALSQSVLVKTVHGRPAPLSGQERVALEGLLLTAEAAAPGA